MTSIAQHSVTKSNQQRNFYSFKYQGCSKTLNSQNKRSKKCMGIGNKNSYPDLGTV